MKQSTWAAIVFFILGIGFIWALLEYKWRADAMRPALEAGSDAASD